MIKFRNATNRFPPRLCVAILTRYVQTSVRTSAARCLRNTTNGGQRRERKPQRESTEFCQCQSSPRNREVYVETFTLRLTSKPQTPHEGRRVFRVKQSRVQLE